MLKLFSFGLVANLVYVITGAAKQYFIAAQLAVTDVGVYGAWVAQASLLVVLVPFPAYIDVLLKGFSAAPGDHALRGALVGNVLRELRRLVGVAAILLGMLVLVGWFTGLRVPSAEGLLLLLVAQFIGQVADIALRMFQAHQRYAAFLAMRNLPSLVLIIALGLVRPIEIAVVELLTALIVGFMAWHAHAIRGRDQSRQLPAPQLAVRGEQVTLWLARLVQYANNALLRLVVPFIFGAHETGLFFFACIAQIPASLFLSVTTQIFGHALARIGPGEWRGMIRIQAWFLLPNLLYVICMACVIPFWPWLMSHLPGLSQYSAIGFLAFAVALYSSVLASDCTEYLLRSRGLSHIMLRYNLSSICAQITCLGLCGSLAVPLEHTILVCAVAAGLVLTGFSSFAFRRVIGEGAAGLMG